MLRVIHVLHNVQILTLFDATSLGRLKSASVRHNFTVGEVNKQLPIILLILDPTCNFGFCSISSSRW